MCSSALTASGASPMLFEVEYGLSPPSPRHPIAPGNIRRQNMQIRVGYELVFDCPQPIPMILTLHIHSTRVSDITVPDYLITNPSVPIAAYRDGFGNWCSRIVAPDRRNPPFRRCGREGYGEAGCGRLLGATDPGAEPAGRDACISSGKPILRYGQAIRGGLEAVRHFAQRMGARPEPSATSSTITSHLVISTRDRRRRRRKLSRRKSASAGTTLTSRLRSAAA